MSKVSESNVFFRSQVYQYPVIVRGEGIYLYDENGNCYIDSASGASVCNVGHGRREIGEAMAEQAGKIEYAHGSRWTTMPVMQLAEKVTAITPPSLNKLYITSSGSGANEIAIKLSRTYFLERDGKRSMKYRIISRQPSFHGGTLTTMNISGNVRFRSNYFPYFANFGKHIPAPYCYRCPYGLSQDSCGCRCAKALEYAILQEGQDNVAAFIMEPMIGTSIIASHPPKEYYKIVRDICDTYDIMLIFDEVMSGFGRTGKAFYTNYLSDIEPDIMTLGKGLAAGYAPLAGVAAKDKIHDTIKNGSGKFVVGQTYDHHTLSCTAACVVQDIYKREKLFDNSEAMGNYLGKKLDNLRRYPIIGDVRYCGLMTGLEFVADQESKKPFEPSQNVADLVTMTGLKNGIVLYPGGGSVNGKYGDHVMISPPLIINKDQVDDLYNRLENTIAEVCDRLLK